MQRQPGAFQRALLRFIALVLGILLAVLLSVTIYVQKLLNDVHYVQAEPTLPSLENLSNLLPVSRTDPNLIGGNNSQLLNILLIGQDRRENEGNSRSDTILLCTLQKDTNEVIMTSFLRDLYVQIPGHSDNRLNAAYAYGGRDLLSETLKENFNLHIDGIVEVDFTQFSQLIDIAGGVTMELRQDEADAINASIPGNLTAGEQWLTGSQTLAYTRLRNLDADGDFSRTNRQRKVITALVRAYRDTDVKDILSLVAQALPMLSTDMNNLTLLRYAAEFIPAFTQGNTESQQIPANGFYSNQTIEDMAVLVPDLEANRQFLRDTLLPEPLS